MIYARRSAARSPCAPAQRLRRDQRLPEQLRALIRRQDPPPEHVITTARSLLRSHLPTTEPKIGEHAMSVPLPQSSAKPAPVQSPLTLVMPIKDGSAPRLLATIEGLASAPVNPVEAKLDELCSVHFARFVLLEDNTRLAVITTYDGDFRKYVMDFIDHLGEVFDMLLSFVDDWPAEHPVQEHRDEFVDYVEAHDLRCVGSFYSAYPQTPVVDIVAPKETAAG